ncbi:COR domain-containing protein [Emticicia oligotrophica]|uniref:COR domain-containing protein n=1 Tax=Emticicia oligotrophica TaxID=312279 RepID=UPI00273C9120|nr:COR domain-containing protein [Emticicia oligotrophica]
MKKPEEILMLEREMGIKIRENEYKVHNGRVYHLYLLGRQIHNIYPLYHLSKLRTLSLPFNRIIDITPIAHLKILEELDLDNNQIKDISPLTNLKFLRRVSLEKNKIRNISPLMNIKRLRNINLIGNQISTITETFVKNSPLEYDLYDNQEQLSLFNEKVIYLRSNPLNPEIKQAIVSNGREGLLAYYKNIYQSKKPFNEAKLIFLGEPNSGKTSLMEYLLGKPFDEKKRVMTKGVNLEKWRIKEAYQGKTNDYCINFWDFGGQEIQQSIHQFFLTEGTLYIILLSAEHDEQPDKYLEYLNNYAPDSPFIIVINKIEAHPSAKITTNLISEDYAKRYINTFRVSIKEASQGNKPFVEQMEALEKAIRQTLMSLPYIHQEVPKSYFDVKQNLEEKYAKKVPYLSSETYLQICKENDVVAETEDDLLKYLNLLGTVRFFDRPNLRSLQILNPEWLTDGIYRIITHDRTAQYLGKIKKEDLRYILQPESPEQYRYEVAHYDYIIEMMEQFKVAYFDRNEEILYIPAAFREDTPDGLRRNVYKKDALHYYFQYDNGLPSFLIHSFIVQRFADILQENYYWNKGIILQETTNVEPCVALVEQNDRRIDIWLQGQHPQGYLDILREDFRSIHRTMKSLAVKEYLEIEENVTVEYNHLVGLKRRGKTEYSTETKDYQINEILKIVETPKNIQKLEDERNITHFHGNIINHGQMSGLGTGSKNSFVNNYAQNSDLKELQELLTEMKLASQANSEWQNNFTVALKELFELEEATKPSEVKVATSTITKIFNEAKKVKDWVGIGLLPAEIATKVPKMIELYHQIFHL